MELRAAAVPKTDFEGLPPPVRALLLLAETELFEALEATDLEALLEAGVVDLPRAPLCRCVVFFIEGGMPARLGSRTCSEESESNK